MKIMKKNILHIITVAALLITQSGKLLPQTLPTITTTSVSNITATTAVSGGNITSDGGGAINARGVCWAVTPNPTISNSKTSDGVGIGSFTSSITGLLPSTTYYFRAYATNCMGTTYGNDISFSALGGPPVVITTPITAITQGSVTVGGNVITYDAPSKGICYGTSPEPEVGDVGVILAPGGSGGGSYICNISGIPPNTLYYLRAYAMNSYGYSYGEQVTVILRMNQSGATVADIDGNIYNTVKIGNQAWMAENLKTTKYNNGTEIPLIVDKPAWEALMTGGYCWYNNEDVNKNIYGALYNWYAVNTGNLCPIGWHVPSYNEWDILAAYLGGVDIAGGKLKETELTIEQYKYLYYK